MTTLRRIPAVVAGLLLAAHFFRGGEITLTALALAVPVLFFLPWGWAVWTGRLLLFAAATLWIQTAWRIASFRMIDGRPYGRMLLILGAVAAFTAFAAWLAPGRRRDGA